MFNKSDLFQKIDELASQHTGADGRFDLYLVEEGLAIFLHANRHAIDVDRLAKDYVASFDAARRPRFQGNQLNLFEPDAWIPLGRKQRVKMSLAIRENIISWAGIEIHEHTTSTTAHARKMSYINSRLSVWDANSHKTLADLEAAKFSAGPETKEGTTL